jgi:hypothetical protein
MKRPEDDSRAGSEGEADRRTSERVTTRSLVEVKIPTWQAFRSVHAVNVSQGGMRISLGPHARIGLAIDIILTLPNGKRLHLPGQVAHLGGDNSGDIGVRFQELSPKVQAEVDGYIEDLRSGRTPKDEAPAAGMPSGVLIKKKS